MKKTFVFMLISIGFLTNMATAQTPEGFTAGSITLLNGSTVKGYIKENMGKKGTISFTENNTAKSKNYDGTELNGITIGDNNYKCIHGDFFKIICTGTIHFLQKTSKTSSKVLYSGADPIGVAGTDGKKGDYYLYKENALTLLTKKNLPSVAAKELANCPTALSKINTENMAANAEAVTLYNNCTK